MTRDGHADFCNKEHTPGTSPCARIVSAPPAPTPRTEDWTVEELFPNSEPTDMWQACYECAATIIGNPIFMEKHVAWHNKLLP